MKNKNLLSLLLLVMIVIKISAQNVVPPKINFIGLKENWNYISKDTTFIKSPIDIWSSPYWGKWPVDAIIDGQTIYLLEELAAQSPYGGKDGSLLYSIDLNTGAGNWINHNSSYVGNKYREDYFRSRIYTDQDNNLQILGYRDIDTLDKTMPKFGFYANPVQRTISKTDGKLLSLKVGNEQAIDTFNATGLGFSYLHRNSYNDIFHCYTVSTFDSKGALSPEIVLREITDSFAISKDKTFSQKFRTNQTNITPNALYQNQIIPLNSDTLIALLGKNDFEDKSLSPLEAKLYWVDITDRSTIKTVKEVNIEDEVIRSGDNQSRIFLQASQNTLILHQLTVNTNPAIDSKSYNWLLWMDADGNKLAKVNYIANKERNYTALQVIDIKDNELYFSTFFSTNSEMGMDILKIRKGSDQVIKVGSISIATNQKYRLGNFAIAKLLPDDNIFLGFRVEYDIKNIKTLINYYYSFKLSDLGLISSTTDQSTSATANLYPNPTTGICYLSGITAQASVSVRGIDGRSYYMGKYNDSAGIDLSTAPNGLYVVTITTGQKTETMKVVKN